MDVTQLKKLFENRKESKKITAVLDQFIKRVYFDTTVYSLEAMELLIKVAGVDNVIFASEMLGGVNASDPATGRSFDDNRRLIDAIA